jgi:hypothetical protein
MGFQRWSGRIELAGFSVRLGRFCDEPKLPVHNNPPSRNLLSSHRQFPDSKSIAFFFPAVLAGFLIKR